MHNTQKMLLDKCNRLINPVIVRNSHQQMTLLYT